MSLKGIFGRIYAAIVIGHYHGEHLRSITEMLRYLFIHTYMHVLYTNIYTLVAKVCTVMLLSTMTA